MVTTDVRAMEPKVARRLLRYEIQRMCAHGGVTHAQMGARLGVSRAAFSQLMAGKSLPSRAALEILTRHLGASAQLPKLLDLLVRARSLAGSTGNDRELSVGLEAYADAIEVYDPLVITPLMRTARYAAAVSAAGPAVAGNPRGGVLAAETPPALVWLVEEHVLRRQIGDIAVMAEQHAHLRKMAASPNVTVQVIPTNRGAHPGLGGGFEIVHGSDGSVVCEHARRTTHYYDHAEVVAHYATVFSDLRKLALSPDESGVMLSTL